MNLEQLRSFRGVAVTGGFSKAAESLFLTQSTISMQVAALERELGIKLFERLGRGVALTPAGKEMLHYATRILALAEDSKQAMADFRGTQRGELTVGASLTIGSYLAPELLGAYRRLYPGIHLSVDISPTYRLLESVADGSMDVALVEGSVHDPELLAEPFQTDELVVIVPTGHRWAGREWLEARELLEEPFLEREPNSGTREIVQERLAEIGVVIHPLLELGNPEALKRAVLAGLGVAIVSAATVGLETSAGVLATLRLRDVELSRPLYIVTRRDKHLSPALSAFIELVRAAPSGQGR